MSILTKLSASAGPILLLLLTALAGYAYSQVRFLSLPIPQALGLFTVVLPLITGITTQGVFGLIKGPRSNDQSRLPIPLVVIIGFQLIYETIIATLALTHILPPSELACGLDSRWAALYRQKNGRAVRAIQDTFNCCGLRTVWDRAYPFQNNAHESGNCAEYFHRSESCFGEWRRAEQVNAGLFLLVAIIVFFFKVFSLINILTGSSLVSASWARAFKQRSRQNGNDLEDNRAVTRRLIEDGEYHDEPTEQTPNGTRTLEASNRNDQDQGPRLEPSQLIEGGNQWRNEEGGERTPYDKQSYRPKLPNNHDLRMKENLGTAFRARAEWSTSPQRARKRRNSRLANHQTIKTSRTATTPTSPASATCASSYQIYLQHSPEQQLLDFYEFQTSSPKNSGLNPATTHDGRQTGGSWFSSFPDANNPTALTTSLQNVEFDNISPLDTSVSPIDFSNALSMPWAVPNPDINNVKPDVDDMFISDSRYGSFESMAISANTAPSSISEGYVFPTTEYSFGTPEGQLIGDLTLSDQYYHRPSLEPPYSSPTTLASPSFSEELLSEGDFIPISTAEWNYPGIYPTENVAWPTNTYIVDQQAQNAGPEKIPIRSRTPWNSQDAQISDFAQNATPGCVAFEPSRGAPYKVFKAREELLKQAPRTNQVFGPELPEDNESWQMVPSYANSFSSQSPQQSHDSPKSHNSPHSHDSPSSDSNAERHSHVIFSAFPGVRKSKHSRGRLRPLTTQEKREAREVREVGACWACHLSKIKCSPCSPGSPCEQCTRLLGKRRFCLLPCFNDPIETLNKFMVPDYLMGHFTKANVEAFLDRSGSCWGTQIMQVRLNWGHRRSLEANVVALTVGDHSSDLSFQHHAISTGTGRPTFLRQASPPLGIPLAAVVDMQDSYSLYVQEIVRNDLFQYLNTVYDDEESKLPEYLLRAICTFYEAGLEVDDECELLRQAIEMHVTSTILERSLILDSESINKVQNHLQQEFPARSAPRCAQRQIKLIFFFIHRQRIMDVLKRWGTMMWTSNNSTSSEYKWAIGFSVFLALTLVIDKTLVAAYIYCEGQIINHGREAVAERAKFQTLVLLTQRELFERCREIFHSKFKTRKAGKESYNPIRDGRGAFRGKAVDGRIATLVYDLQNVVHGFEKEIRSDKTSKTNYEYTDAGRLASIFLDDFLEH